MLDGGNQPSVCERVQAGIVSFSNSCPFTANFISISLRLLAKIFQYLLSRYFISPK